MELPCKDCIAFPMCKIDKIVSTDHCREYIGGIYTKCSLIHDYVEAPVDFEIEKIEKFLEIILYLCDHNLYIPYDHLVMDYEGGTTSYYCIKNKTLIEVTGEIPCPLCNARIRSD